MEERKRRLGAAHAVMLRHGTAYDDVQLNNIVLQDSKSDGDNENENENDNDNDNDRGHGSGCLGFLDLEFAYLSEPEKAERGAEGPCGGLRLPVPRLSISHARRHGNGMKNGNLH
jgi:hypothetical protein